MAELPRDGVLIEAEMRKVCERGHTRPWVPWYARRARVVLGHCLCGAPYRRETRGPKPLDIRAFNAALDQLALGTNGKLTEAETEELTRRVLRTYFNELEDCPNEEAAGAKSDDGASQRTQQREEGELT